MKKMSLQLLASLLPSALENVAIAVDMMDSSSISPLCFFNTGEFSFFKMLAWWLK